ncbi:DNA helicase [Microbacterium sp. NPDC091313]
MSLSRKSKKELRKLRKHAAKVWESQQVLLGEGGDLAREAGRAVSSYSREQVVPAVKDAYGHYAAPYVEKGAKLSRHVLADRVVPTAGALVGGAMSVWDAANDTRSRLAAGKGFELDAKKYAKRADKYGKKATKKLAAKLPAQRSGIGAGGVIAILLGIAAAAGVVYAAWQTLRADDELWVADDPLRAPDA